MLENFLRRCLRLARRYRLTLTQQIFVGLGLGIVAGTVVSKTDPELANFFRPFSDLFLRLIKMIIAPIIFTSLVSGVAGAGHAKRVGRLGLKALLFFEFISFFALAVGLVSVNVIRPGVGLMLPTDTGAPIDVVPAPHKSWDQIMLHTVPTSVVQAMAEGDVLQIVVFSILFAIALGSLGERAKPFVAQCEIAAAAMFKLTKMIMHYAPIGVSAAIVYTIGRGGLPVLFSLAWLVGTLYFTLAMFLVVFMLPCAYFLNVPVKKFFRVVKEPAVIAFSTTSSEAALPRAMEGLELLGVPKRVVSFILPLGYSFNLVGTTLYLSLAAVFVAQVAGVELTWGQQATMLVTLMLTSKGVAAVPRASLVILAGTLTQYGLPLEGLSLILGVDTLMDMGRTLVNVIGNCLATVVVAKWEGEFVEADDAALAVLDAPEEGEREDDDDDARVHGGRR